MRKGYGLTCVWLFSIIFYKDCCNLRQWCGNKKEIKVKINFTKQTIMDLDFPKKGLKYYRDIKEKGLSIYITSNEIITFFVRKRIEGKDERVIIGSFPERSIESARKQARVIKGLIAQGINPNDKKNTLRQEITFKELFVDYMERYSKQEKRTWKGDENDINRFLNHWFNKKISTITNNEIRLLHEKIKINNGLYQANRVLVKIRAIYNKALEWGWQGVNPTNCIKKFKEKSRDRFLQVDEFPRFWDAVMKEENSAPRDYVILSLLTGARKSNVLSMCWDDVHLERGQWRIPETKNGEPLTVSLPQLAINILAIRKETSTNEWVFPSLTSKSGHLEEPKRAWKRILKRADIKDLRIHDLRRTLGSWQAATGATTAIIGKSLGHKNKNTTAIYERLNLDPVKQAVERATDAMIETFGTEEEIIKKLKLHNS
jgi:integrase